MSYSACALINIALAKDNNNDFHLILVTIIQELKHIISVIETIDITNEDTKDSVFAFLTTGLAKNPFIRSIDQANRRNFSIS